jgi:hypothetical protein
MLGEEGILVGSELRLCWWLTQVYFGNEKVDMSKQPSVGKRGQFILYFSSDRVLSRQEASN